MQVQGSRRAVVVPVCLGLAPLSILRGRELAKVLLGIKPGPQAGVYCSFGCLEVTGRNHVQFVKMNRAQRYKTDKLFIQHRWLGLALTAPKKLPRDCGCLCFTVADEFPWIHTCAGRIWLHVGTFDYWLPLRYHVDFWMSTNVLVIIC